jgi:hypothetical protein
VATSTLTSDAAIEQEVADRRISEASLTRHAPLVLVAGVLVFNACSLVAELLPVSYLNDASFQEAYVRWAAGRIRAGETPFDGLFAPLGLGFPIFHHYQVLPHLISGLIGAVLSPDGVYRWSAYLLLVGWPICIYVSARLLERSQWTAALAAAVSPFLMSLPGYGYERGSYEWRGYGVWTQLWAMWLLPLAVALAWRAIARRRSIALAAVLVGATLTTHVITGYLALLVIPAVGLVLGRPLWHHFWRALAIDIAGLALSAWLLVPAARDARWTYNTIQPGSFWLDSYGARKVLGWLMTGGLFDAGRFPIVTILVGIGLVSCAVRVRRDSGVRAVLALFFVSLLLYFGRPTLGPIVNLLPGHDELFLQRMIIGVQLGGIFIAGIGAVAIGRAATRATRYLGSQIEARRLGNRTLFPSRPRPVWLGSAVVLVVVVAVGTPAWLQIRRYDNQDAVWIVQQRQADATQGREFQALLSMVGTDGRVFAGYLSGYGSTDPVGFVPGAIELTNLDALGIGFTGRVPAITQPAEERFNWRDLNHYELFNVRYAILPASQEAPPSATLIASKGGLNLFQVSTSGWLRVVDTTPAIDTTTANLPQVIAPFMVSDLAERGVYPLMTIAGQPAATATLAAGQRPSSRPGSVSSEYGLPYQGEFGGTVELDRRGTVVVPVSFSPRWEVTVDGEQRPLEMVAPGFLAVSVGAGRHLVQFQYDPVSFFETLFLVGLGVMVTVATTALDRRSRRDDARAVLEDGAPSAGGRGRRAWRC